MPDLSSDRSKAGFVHGLQEGCSLLRRKAVLALVRHRLIATVVGALDRSSLDFAGLAGDSLALLGGVVLGDRLGAHLVQPHIAVGLVGLFASEADRVVSPGFPSLHTVHAAFTAHSVPSVAKSSILISLHLRWVNQRMI